MAVQFPASSPPSLVPYCLPPFLRVRTHEACTRESVLCPRLSFRFAEFLVSREAGLQFWQHWPAFTSYRHTCSWTDVCAWTTSPATRTSRDSDHDVVEFPSRSTVTFTLLHASILFQTLAAWRAKESKKRRKPYLALLCCAVTAWSSAVCRSFVQLSFSLHLHARL